MTIPLALASKTQNFSGKDAEKQAGFVSVSSVIGFMSFDNG
jgi:hypothetical protein